MNFEADLHYRPCNEKSGAHWPTQYCTAKNDEPSLPDIKLLRLLDQLYATRSVTRATEALGQSQPTVSIWLARLRKELGDPLFVRSADGMLPTPRTDALMPTVREVLAELQRLAQSPAPFDAATSERRFAVCMTDASHITLLPRLLAHVRARARRDASSRPHRRPLGPLARTATDFVATYSLEGQSMSCVLRSPVASIRQSPIGARLCKPLPHGAYFERDGPPPPQI